MATTVCVVLHRASKQPTSGVAAYLNRPALGHVVIADTVTVQSGSPQDFRDLAAHFAKVAEELEDQQRKDRYAAVVAATSGIPVLSDQDRVAACSAATV